MEGQQCRKVARIHRHPSGMTEAQAIHKVYQMFKEAGETAAADSLTTYLLLGNNIPSFSHILYDIDNLFKVNHVSNALDIVNKLNLKSSSATEAVAKIEKLSKLVIGGNVTIHTRTYSWLRPLRTTFQMGLR